MVKPSVAREISLFIRTYCVKCSAKERPKKLNFVLYEAKNLKQNKDAYYKITLKCPYRRFFNKTNVKTTQDYRKL